MKQRVNKKKGWKVYRGIADEEEGGRVPEVESDGERAFGVEEEAFPPSGDWASTSSTEEIFSHLPSENSFHNPTRLSPLDTARIFPTERFIQHTSTTNAKKADNFK